MLLGNLIKCSKKDYQKIVVNGIAFDSRKVKQGNIFFAIKGNNISGNKFIKEAILKKASVIISNKKVNYKNYKTPVIKVKNVRKSLSEACSNYYKKKPKNILAVTGTNGKSSVANFFYQILDLNGISSASIGTLGILSKNYKKKTSLTSMDPLSLHKNLELLAKKKINNVILEASSHGLQQRRLDNLKIKTGVFTNLSHDHLDYHKNMKSYLNSKMYLFKKLLNKKSIIVTDETNKEFKIIKNVASRKRIKKITIGLTSGDIKILNNQYLGKNQIVTITCGKNIFTLKIPLIGYFQIKNLLMAILAASTCGLSKTKIFNKVKKIKSIPGRLECIKNFKNKSSIILDFAHTPDALEQSLIALKNQFNKEIIIVFGCGGDRDKKKRFRMGQIAKKYCRKIFITDDNPRNESPKKIRNAIMKACKKKAINIGSRKNAIKMAINELEPNEILLVTGKGHESTQNYGNRIIDFSDRKVIKEIASKKKYKIKNYNYNNFLIRKNFNNSINKNINFNNVSINTKDIKKNDLFFAVKGKNTDGHKFVNEAIKKGAAKVVISKKIKIFSKNKILKVKNTLNSLNGLAKINRKNTSAEIIGITGSAGKTTLKNLIGFALKNYGKVHCSPHSYNNKFGVPLSVSNIKNNTKYGVFEIGMDKKGEIDYLSKIVRPEIGIITNIAGAHFKNFKTLKDIAKAKSEIINNIVDNGTIILNKDDKFFNFLSNKAKSKKINIISFSTKKNADISLIKKQKINNGYKLKVQIREKTFDFYSSNFNDNFIRNILACLATIFTLNLNFKTMKKKFVNFSVPQGRGDVNFVRKFNKKFKFIDESYNANPLSMHSAIKNISSYKVNNYCKKLVLLGDMLELGKKSKKLHSELSYIINKSNIDKVFVYGKYIKETFKKLSKNKNGKIFNNFKQINDQLGKIINNNDLLMIKGSNATGLNKFSKNIKKGQIGVI